MSSESEEIGRREQVLAVTERLVLASGSPNISFNAIADELGVTRSLLYVYFESVAQIIDELFFEQCSELERLVKQVEAAHADFRPRMLALFRGYMLHLVQRGQLIQIVLRERHQDSPLQQRSSRLFQRILLTVASDARRELQMTPRAAFVTLELLAAIPEALARLVRNSTVDDVVALTTCERLLGAALDALAVRQQHN